MVNPMPIEVRTMIGDAMLGRTCRATRRKGDAPSAAVDSTNTSFWSARVSAYTTRANHGQYVADRARITLGSDGPRVCAIAMASTTCGTARKMSDTRIKRSLTQVW